MTVNNSILKTINKEDINVVLSSFDNKNIYRFFVKMLGKNNVFEFDDLEYGFRHINLVVCINRKESLEKSLSISYHLHCPLLVIDHTIQPPQDNPAQKFINPNLTHMQIATSQNVANSYDIDNYHNILPIDIKDKTSINKWKNLVVELSQQQFSFTNNTENKK